ncbi:FERM domain-containing protein 8 [Fopius arisanus]|uniref:FERM domain-containing protein 8 n=1 Tax=Fopius arisanus TaxID=64838 RepID=A0A9R1T6A1_9HYME|nr:PREDICTED: FERM domain-containing protein 8 [Fopius arisanus]
MEQEEGSGRRANPGRRYPNSGKREAQASPHVQSSKGEPAPQNSRQSVRIAVYLMSGVFLTMEVDRNSTAQQIQSIVQTEPEIGMSRLSQISGETVFAMWMCSSQLELQLRPNHRPIDLASKWSKLVNKYGTREQSDEEPLLYFRRNVFLSRIDEEMIKDPKMLELLYAEARHNVLEGRYPCEGQARYASLGALQARIELGPYNPQTHTLAYFRKHRAKFLPHHYTSPGFLFGLGFGLGIVGGKGAPEARLLEQYKRIPNHSGTTPNSRKLVRKYLEFCWGLPCYGSAFFQGQIERPVRGLASWITNRDMSVLIAINTTGVYVVDDSQCSLLLGLKYSNLSWEMAKPSDENNLDCLPCLFLQFPVRENGTRVYKILQVFSKQAIMMDTLISGFAEDNRLNEDTVDAANQNRTEGSVIMNAGSFTNKLSKFTLATFDDQGRCIGQMGSWSFQ